MEFKTFDKEEAQRYIDNLLLQEDITVKQWAKSSCGRAYPLLREVKIPRPIDEDTFGVCLHEIGHIKQCNDIVINYGAFQSIKEWKKIRQFELEYFAEQYALFHLKNLNYNHLNYEFRARKYVTMKIAKAYARKLRLEKISQEIRDFCKVDFDKWKDYKVFVDRRYDQIAYFEKKPRDSIQMFVKSEEFI